MPHQDKDVLEVKLDFDETVKDYLKRLLIRLWIEGESFSSKRPFGHGDWQVLVYEALIRANLVDGTLDPNGFVDEIDMARADELILEAIDSL